MRDEAEKRRLDRQTPYLSLLPEMDEGMHIGYQEKAGIQCDGNQKPREWLENFARFLKTPGREVGYAIPDAFEKNLMIAILSECGLSQERIRLQEERNRAELQAQSPIAE